MAQNVTVEGNFLLITNTVTNDWISMNSAWTSAEFTSNSVILKSYLQTGLNVSGTTIAFADFQGNGVAINTAEGIRTFLSDKIG